MDSTKKILLIIIVFITLTGCITYTWNDKTLNNCTDVYCGFFGKRVIKSIKKGTGVIIGCECEPVEIENGTFDPRSCDYTCDKGYEKWFDGIRRRYRTTPGLRGDIPLRELYAHKPDNEPYCVTK